MWNIAWTGEPLDVPAVDHWFRVSERVWDSAHVHLQQAVRRHKDFPVACRSHTPVYCPGDQVWLSTQDLRLHLPCRKLSPRFIGPFTIERQINDVTFLLQLPARYRIHPAFHISLLKPFSPSVPGSEEPAVPPPPEVQEEPAICQAWGILDSRRRTQRPWPAPSPSWGVRSHPWRRGYCQGVTVIAVTSVTINYTHQIQLTWLLITATSHQEHYINHYILLPISHCLVSNIPCWLTWPSYLLSTVSSFLCSAPRSPPLLCSTVSELQFSRWSSWIK